MFRRAEGLEGEFGRALIAETSFIYNKIHIKAYMEKIIPISDLQSKAKKYVDRVRETDEPVIVTRRGRAAAVLMSYGSYEGFLATREEMSFPDWRRRLGRAERESKEGKGVPLKTFLAKKRRRAP
jgi:prevent-host-death family protein